ncbi:MAG: hypothetical protein JXB49_27765 [Bacteroidales bacterium]|nr:hypothetical protein [Bacteroidales bacterium]
MAAGDITDDLLVQLGERLEEPELDGDQWSLDLKLDKLNEAQIKFVNMIHPSYLTELEVVDENVDMSTGEKDIETLSAAVPVGSGCTTCNQYANGSVVLHGAKGILNVFVRPGGDFLKGKWATPINFKAVKRYDSGLYKYSDTNILYYVFGAKLRIMLTTLEDTTADIYWLKIPCQITQSADPEINSAFFQITLDIAESLCWPKEGEFEARRTGAWEAAVRQVEMLNGKI